MKQMNNWCGSLGKHEGFHILHFCVRVCENGGTCMHVRCSRC